LPKPAYHIHCRDTIEALEDLSGSGFAADLVISSPPYNIGKAYEARAPLAVYMDWQAEVVQLLSRTIRPGGNLVWQVGNYVDRGEVLPLDYLFIPVMQEAGFKLRNRFMWHFGHGLHAKHRFSGRHETVLWFSHGDGYFHDPRFILPAGQEPPADADISPVVRQAMETGIWDIPNVKHNHPEKLDHPCQFTVAIAERAVLGLSRPGDLVLDPFCGVASAGVAALAHGRFFTGIERHPDYCVAAESRLDATLEGSAKWRPHDLEVARPRVAVDGGPGF